MYYLNAFNEMLRRRQQQNNMMGGGQDYGVGTTAPSGPMGLGPAQDRSGFRDAAAVGLGEYGPAPVGTINRNAYEGAVTSNSFNEANMGGGVGSPNFGAPSPFAGYADDSNSRLGGMTTVGAPIGGSVTGTALGSLGGELQGGRASNQTGLYGDASAGMGGYGGFGGGGLGGSSDGDAGVGGGFGLYANGGMVHAKHLKGRAPAPDDGYGALQGGEYVITKAAVEKYGKRMMDAINNGTFR